jgi:hypothetical protein
MRVLLHDILVHRKSTVLRSGFGENIASIRLSEIRHLG